MCVCVTRQQMSMDSNMELFLDCFGVYFKFYPCIILLQYHSLLQGKEGQKKPSYYYNHMPKLLMHDTPPTSRLAR